MKNDYDLFGRSIGLIGGANMASKEEILSAINDIVQVIGDEYYDGDGDELLRHIVDYLTSKL